MIPKEYKDFCADLARNFDKDWSKVSTKLDFGHQFLDHVPTRAWHPMVKIAVDNWEGWPRNWVRSVKDIYEMWRRAAGPAGLGINYNRDDDPRFPVELMHQAFGILEKHGYRQYMEFCNHSGVPRTDRDRIEHKHKVCSWGLKDDFKIPEIGVRVNEKTNRPAFQAYREPGE